MTNVRKIHVDWYGQQPPRFHGGPQLAYQGDHLSNMVVFDHAPELPNYYLLVKMKTDDAGAVDTLPAIMLEGPYWVIPNYYTQICQKITYQVCCKTETGDYEHHSAMFEGTILPTIKHDGEPIDQSPMFDPYIDILDKRVEELIVAAGDIQIDSELKSDSGNPVQNRVVKAAIDGLENDVDAVNGRLQQVKEDLNILTDNNLTLVETATEGATNAYKIIENKLLVNAQYAFKVTSRTAGTYLFQAGIGQSASSMYDIGTYTFGVGETKTITGYSTDNRNIKYFRLYSADVPLANMDWDVSVYTYFDAQTGVAEARTALRTEMFDNVDSANITLTKAQYFNTSGTTVNINSPIVNDGWYSVVVECVEGDAFTITGTGGSTPRLWVFADASGNILTRNQRTTETNLEIIAPKNAKYLVANFSASYDRLLLKGISISNRLAIADYENRITTKQKIVVDANGSGDFTTIQAAIDSITDSSFTNQYEIILLAGTYVEQNLILPPYTYLHGVGQVKPVITSEGLTEYVSVIDAQNTCRIANVKVVSATKYCLHEDVSLHGCTVICEDVDFEQLGTSNVTIIGNGVFQNAKFVFEGCTFKGGQVFSHTNSNSYIGVTQHLVIRYCKFTDAGIVLSVSGNVESNTIADCICEVIGCKGDGTYPLITCRVPTNNVFPWKVIGGGNINFSVVYDGETLTGVINTTDV